VLELVEPLLLHPASSRAERTTVAVNARCMTYLRDEA
jgi:hypothetical protein